MDPRFVALLKSSISRLVGQKIIKPHVNDLEFWTRWPNKFREAKRYKKKTKSSSIGVQSSASLGVSAAPVDVNPTKSRRAASEDVAGNTSRASASCNSASRNVRKDPAPVDEEVEVDQVTKYIFFHFGEIN